MMIFYKSLNVSIFLFGLLLSPLVHSQNSIEDCHNKTAVTPEIISSCLGRIIEVADRELKTWVNLYQFDLEAENQRSGLMLFKRSQKNFTLYRESNCRWQYLTTPKQSTAAIDYKECYILVTQTRIKELTRFYNLVKKAKQSM